LNDKLLNKLSILPYTSTFLSERLFKLAIRQVIIEISSACNRRCGYCPNSFVKKPVQKMSEDILEKILTELKSINYSQNICLNLYNEPLFYYDQLLDILKRIRDYLPKVSILFSSNGDFLTRERIRELRSAGLNALYITIHPDDELNWSSNEISNSIIRKCSDWDLTRGDIRMDPDKSVYCDVSMGSLKIQLFSINFLKIGVNRAGALKNIESSYNLVRTAPCFRPLHDITIAYDGTVYPCCQFYHGYKPHNKFSIGSVSSSRLSFLFSSATMRRFRKMATGTGRKSFPCNNCSE
jgi:radical SAM protein with 4Fe4S-binding SPASM domain